MRRLFYWAHPGSYRLRTLFVAVAMFCVVTGFVAERRRRAFELHANCLAIASSGGFVILEGDASVDDSVFSYSHEHCYGYKYAGEVTVRDWFLKRHIAVVEFGRTPASVCESVLANNRGVRSAGLHEVRDTQSFSIDWSEHTQLESLWLFPGASEEQLAGISGCTKLSRLRIENCPSDMDIASIVAKCRLLDNLTMSHCGLHDNDISTLATLDNLRQLLLYGNPELTDESLIIIASAFPNLSVLYLSGTSVNGSEMNQIASLSQLNLLNLSHTNINDDVLELLSEIPTLQFLNVSGCDVSQAGVERFRAKSHCVLTVDPLQ